MKAFFRTRNPSRRNRHGDPLVFKPRWRKVLVDSHCSYAYPTPFFTGLQQPADPNRAGEYGAVGEIPGKMFGTFMEMLKGPNAPNPHDIAEAIATLVSQPKGTRAARTVVGNAFGADVINRDNAVAQAQTVAALGLAQLDLLLAAAATPLVSGGLKTVILAAVRRRTARFSDRRHQASGMWSFAL